MAKRRIYRDYRAGHAGQFTTRETFNRSAAQGKECNVHEETVTIPDIRIDSLDDIMEYEDYEDVEPYEYHGTGDTGKKGGK